jgi:hypothetical protein
VPGEIVARTSYRYGRVVGMVGGDLDVAEADASIEYCRCKGVAEHMWCIPSIRTPAAAKQLSRRVHEFDDAGGPASVMSRLTSNPAAVSSSGIGTNVSWN